jgi:ATP-dependent DNA helicase PIF1
LALLYECAHAYTQIILSGDFFQLPPVAKSGGPPYTFAFEADSWPKVFPDGSMMGLTRVFRQKEDTFVKVLEGMRKGRTTTDAAKVLAACDRVVNYEDGIEPVSL